MFRYPLSTAAPVDLVLDWVMSGVGSLDGGLQDALRDCAVHDTIQKVYIRVFDGDLMANTVVSLLTPKAEGIQHSSIKSIYLDDVNASDFFARRQFPKLQDLYLLGSFEIST